MVGGDGRSRQSTMEYMEVAEMPQWGFRDDITASPHFAEETVRRTVSWGEGVLGWFGGCFVSFRWVCLPWMAWPGLARGRTSQGVLGDAEGWRDGWAVRARCGQSTPAGCFDDTGLRGAVCRIARIENLAPYAPPDASIAEHTTSCPLGVLDLARCACGTVCRCA